MPGAEQFHVQGENLNLEKKIGETQEGKNDDKLGMKNANELAAEVNKSIDNVKDQLRDIPDAVSTAFRKDVAEYFVASVETFDKNGNNILNSAEFKEYKVKMVNELKGNLVAFKTKADEGKKEADKAKKSAKDQENEVKKTLKEARSELQAQKIDLETSESKTDEEIEKIKQSEDPEEMKQALQTLLNNRVEKFGKIEASKAQFMDLAQKTTEVHRAAGDEMKALAAANQKAIAAGAAAGALAGSYIPFVGTIAGGFVGAYFTKIAYTDGQEEEHKKLANELNKEIDAGKKLFSEKNELFTKDAQEFRADGNKLNEGTDAIRQKIETKSQSEVMDVSKRAEETLKAAQEQAAQLQELATAKEETLEQKTELQDRASEIEDRQASMQKGAPKEQQAALQEEADKTREAEAALDAQTREIEGAQQGLTQSTEELALHQQDLTLAESSLKAQSEGQNLSMMEIEASIADTVFDQNSGVNNSILDVKIQGDSLGTLPKIEAQEVSLSPLSVASAAFDGLGKSVHYVFQDLVIKNVEWLTDGMKEWAKDKPPLNVLVPALLFPTDVATGLVAGAAELVEGVSMMVAHPLDTVNGLKMMFETDPETGNANIWKVAEYLIAKEDFENGRSGKAIGKVAFNILTTATGLGAAGNGVKAAAIAYKVAQAGGAGVLKASLKAAAKGTTVAATEFGVNVVKNTGNAVKSVLKVPGKLMKAPFKLAQSAKLGKVGRLKDGIKVGTKAVDEAKATAGKFLEKKGLPQQLAGKTAQELKALSGDGAALANLGIQDAKSIRAFLNYRSLVGKAEGAAGALKATKVKLFTTEMKGLKGPAEISRHIDAFAVAQGLDAKFLRVQVAKNILKKKALTQAQEAAILAAHELPGEIGNLKPGEMTAKGRVLLAKAADKKGRMKQLFSAEEAQLLMDNGICGKTSGGAAVVDDAGKSGKFIPDEASIHGGAVEAGSIEDTVKISGDATKIDDYKLKPAGWTPLDDAKALKDQALAAEAPIAEQYNASLAQLRKAQKRGSKVTPDELARLEAAHKEIEAARNAAGIEAVAAENAYNKLRATYATVPDEAAVAAKIDDAAAAANVDEAAATAKAEDATTATNTVDNAGPANAADNVTPGANAASDPLEAAAVANNTPDPALAAEAKAKLVAERKDIVAHLGLQKGDVVMGTLQNGKRGPMKYFGVDEASGRMIFQNGPSSRKIVLPEKLKNVQDIPKGITPGKTYRMRFEGGRTEAWTYKKVNTDGTIVFDVGGKRIRVTPAQYEQMVAKGMDMAGDLKYGDHFDLNGVRVSFEGKLPDGRCRVQLFDGAEAHMATLTADELADLQKTGSWVTDFKNERLMQRAMGVHSGVDLFLPTVLATWRSGARGVRGALRGVTEGVPNAVHATNARVGGALSGLRRNRAAPAASPSAAVAPKLSIAERHIPTFLAGGRLGTKILLSPLKAARNSPKMYRWVRDKVKGYRNKPAANPAATPAANPTAAPNIAQRAGAKVREWLDARRAKKAAGATPAGPSSTASAKTPRQQAMLKQWEKADASISEYQAMRGKSPEATQVVINQYDQAVNALKGADEIPKGWKTWYDEFRNDPTGNSVAARDIATIDSRVLRRELTTLENALEEGRALFEYHGTFKSSDRQVVLALNTEAGAVKKLQQYAELLRAEIQARGLNKAASANKPTATAKPILERVNSAITSGLNKGRDAKNWVGARLRRNPRTKPAAAPTATVSAASKPISRNPLKIWKERSIAKNEAKLSAVEKQYADLRNEWAEINKQLDTLDSYGKDADRYNALSKRKWDLTGEIPKLEDAMELLLRRDFRLKGPKRFVDEFAQRVRTAQEAGTVRSTWHPWFEEIRTADGKIDMTKLNATDLNGVPNEVLEMEMAIVNGSIHDKKILGSSNALNTGDITALEAYVKRLEKQMNG